MKDLFKHVRSDLPASLVVFFVAVPLCLGIALASGAPLFSGIIAGIVGGIVVGFFSGSALGVSGPAAGLAVIVLNAITDLGGVYETFLMAVVLAGVIQLVLGYIKAGFIAYFFPSSVIKGMLTGIGLLIILKQIPHALGRDLDFLGDEAFRQMDGENTFSEIISALGHISSAALIITIISLTILIVWEKVLAKKSKVFNIINGPLVVVVLGIVMQALFAAGLLPFSLRPDQLVTIPVPQSAGDFFAQFTLPAFDAITNPEVWQIAAVMAVVASLETLLSVEATDKLDPDKRITPANRELKAQGIGNIVSGLIGGLPITQVIVRSSANIAFGAKSKLSTIMHGLFLLLSAVTIAGLLNMIPLASLAAILFMVGYKLAKPSLFKQMYKLGWQQFAPFVVTIVAILFTDLLIGILAGMAVGIFFTLLASYKNSHYMQDMVTSEDGHSVHHIVLAEEVSFFNKANIMRTLESIPEKSKVIIDGSNSVVIDPDVLELIENFEANAKTRNIVVEKIKIELN